MKPLKLLLLRIVFLMGVYSVIRAAFFLYNHGLYQNHSHEDALMSFVYGMRFDLAGLCWLNAVFFLFAMVPRFPPVLNKAVFYLLNSSFLIGNLVDLELFNFNGRRMSREFFTSATGDILEQMPHLVVDYWFFPLIGFSVAAVLWYADSKVERKLHDQIINGWKIALLGLLLPGLVFVAIRGGLQQKSIQVQTAFIQGSNELGHLTLNTTYHFLRTYNAPVAPRKSWFSNEDLEKQVQQLTSGSTTWGSTGDNVVLIILESFSQESYEGGYMPFLRELALRGVSVERNFANVRHSIEVLSSVLDAIPSVQEIPFSKSPASSMSVGGIGSNLRSHNYTSVFFHGAGKGSMGFETYTMAHGFHRYYSREDFDGAKDAFDGQWGIFDGPWLQFSLREINKIRRPFFAGIFTLTSHQPYTIPKEWRGKFPKGTLDIHESIGYTDHMVREFFAVASKQSWFKDTLFIVTADHTQKLESPKFLNSVGLYRVPLILFHPSKKLPREIARKVTQHVDIPATVLDWLNVPMTGLNFVGESVFAQGEGRALQYLQPGWQLVRGNRVLLWDETSPGREFIWNSETGEMQDSGPTGMETEAKVLIQYLLNSFRTNRWPVVRRE